MEPVRARRRGVGVRVLGGLAVAALAFAAGRVSLFAVTAPPSAVDAGFARDMQVHHAQAVELAMQVYRTTADDSLRALAYDIATTQSAQQGEMYDWLVRWGMPQSGAAPMSWLPAEASHVHDASAATSSPADPAAAMGLATAAESARLRESEGLAADCLFLALMTRHHEGAIPMARAAADHGSDARVVQVARAMVSAQSAEIDAMAAMRLRLACTP